jgi:predicted dehydrogenase
MPRRLVIAGVGLHAQAHYLPLLSSMSKQGKGELIAAIDLKSRQPRVEQALAQAGMRVAEFVGLDSEQPSCQAEAFGRLDEIAAHYGCDGLIISTDPRNHLPYLRWGARRNVDVLVDKPLTARVMEFTSDSAGTIWSDYQLVRDLFSESTATVTIMAGRRLHAGYRLMRETISDIVNSYGVPISYLNMYHANGYWNMPDEFFSRENHPYKYGFGALLHGGYHAVDVAGWLLSANQSVISGNWADTMEVLTQHATPDDVMEQEPEALYRQLGLDGNIASAYTPEGRLRARTFGETDINISFAAKRGPRIVTMGGISVTETGLSTRAWGSLPEDTYKSNGRYSQERLTIHMGHLLTMHADDYRPLPEDADPDQLAPAQFVLRILRNSRLIGGKPYEEHVISVPRGSDMRHTSFTENAIGELFSRWMAGEAEVSGLETHGLSIALMGAAYESMFSRRRGLSPVATFPIPCVA